MIKLWVERVSEEIRGNATCHYKKAIKLDSSTIDSYHIFLLNAEDLIILKNKAAQSSFIFIRPPSFSVYIETSGNFSLVDKKVIDHALSPFQQCPFSPKFQMKVQNFIPAYKIKHHNKVIFHNFGNKHYIFRDFSTYYQKWADPDRVTNNKLQHVTISTRLSIGCGHIWILTQCLQTTDMRILGFTCQGFTMIVIFFAGNTQFSTLSQ